MKLVENDMEKEEIKMFMGNEVAIDLGTANTLIYNKNKGLLYNEPSFVALNRSNKRVIALGHEAKEMLGRTNDNIDALRPLIDGVISEYESVVPMIKEILRKIPSSMVKGRLTISVPNGVSEIEMRAVIDLGHQMGFSRLEIVDEPVVAALGEGVDINEARGNMIVDIGAGTTDIAVISLGSIAVGRSIKIASDDFDDAIIRLLRDEFNLDIGKLTAEKTKIEYSKNFYCDGIDSLEITGLNLIKGVPEKKVVTFEQITKAIMPMLDLIIEGICDVLENTGPELVADIMETGIILTGGGSINPLIESKIENRCALPVICSKTPLNSVGNGLMKKICGYKVREKSLVH